MTNLSLVSPDGVSENQVIRSNVAKTQQPDAERLKLSHSELIAMKIIVNKEWGSELFLFSKFFL